MKNFAKGVETPLEQVRQLEKTDMSRDQAQALIKIMGQQVHVAVSSAVSGMATKKEAADIRTDIADIRTKMATKNEAADIRTDIADIRTKMATKDDIARIDVTLAEIKTALRYQLVMMTVMASGLIALAVKVF